MVVVDPRKTETARDADEHVAILPGGDAALLLSMTQVIVSEGLADRAHLAERTRGWEAIEARLPAFAPERVAAMTGLEPATIRRLAREFAAAPTSVAYTRVGVCNGQWGTVASLATDVLNLAAGRLGKIGGWMFPTPAFDPTPIVKFTKADGHDRWRSRVRGLSETLGDLPASILAEEIETPGAGQVRGMLTFAGNPVLSVPNGRRLAAALETLEFMASVDLYINETTRHADVILPPAWSLCDEHVELISSGNAVRNVVRWSPRVVPPPADGKADWEILLEIIYRLGGGPLGTKALDWFYRWGRKIGIRWRPDSTVDLVLRIGPYGDRYVPWSKGLNLKKLKAATHGIDLGPLAEGIAHRVLHRDRRVHVDAPVLLAGVDELAAALDQRAAAGDDTLLLVGRRELRSNNSWMHNVPQLVSGHARCVLLVHPLDAAQRGIADGDSAVLTSRVHSGEVPVCISDEVRRGVVCLPHGWGHAESARWQHTAGEHAGVSFNDWTDDREVESIVGQSILNGVRVTLTRRDGAGHLAATEATGAAHRSAPAARLVAGGTKRRVRCAAHAGQLHGVGRDDGAQDAAGDDVADEVVVHRYQAHEHRRADHCANQPAARYGQPPNRREAEDAGGMARGKAADVVAVVKGVEAVGAVADQRGVVVEPGFGPVTAGDIAQRGPKFVGDEQAEQRDEQHVLPVSERPEGPAHE